MTPHIHIPGPGRGSANKPFITEYKLAFKDPTPFLRKGTQPGAKKKKLAQDKKDKEKALAKAAETTPVREPKIIVDEKPKINPLLSKRKDIWVGVNTDNPDSLRVRKYLCSDVCNVIFQGPPVNKDGDQTSLTLPAMLPQQNHPNSTFRRRRVLAAQNISNVRYNIISGIEIGGEPHSGFKEGRRAVIQTFARIDLITNARSAGYNIISARDYDLDEEVAQKLQIH
ncbi:UNVERIFIED_CONTAM: hypothetical protein HDU68_001038 [Siphonaria sp. JEL0065]|nr:hypothetical protein HDU68_001038 [Siphonaria sp. JEL0065]